MDMRFSSSDWTGSVHRGGSALRRWMSTAARMIRPLVTCWISTARFISVSRLKMSAKVMTPRNVPTIVARPPARLVPPMTTAAIASSS